MRANQAETLYEEILKQDPEHGDALHLLGLVHYQQGDPERAMELISKVGTFNTEYAVCTH